MKTATCARVRSEIPFYLENESDPFEALEMARHLGSCDSCAEEASRDRRALSALRAIAHPTPPRDIAGGALRALKRLRETAVDHAALKWTALGLMLACLAAHASLRFRGSGDGLRLVEKIGELVDVNLLLGRVLEFFYRFLPSASRVIEGMIGGSPLADGAGPAPPHFAVLIFLSGAILASLLLSGALLAGSLLASGRARRIGRRVFRLF